MEYITTRVNRTSPTVIEGRIYYEDIEANEEFGIAIRSILKNKMERK